MDENELTRRVIACFRRVYNCLGGGLPERPYVRALAYECTRNGLSVERESPITIYYERIEIGRYRADLLVEDRLIVEARPAISFPNTDVRC
jgi:GxxExxY protein